MITLMKVIEACNARVSGGSEYGWDCYGSDARWMDFSDVDGKECVSVVFDSKTQAVYELDITVPGYDQAFVWRNPNFQKAYLKECKKRDLRPNKAWDDILYQEVDAETAIKYVKDIVATYYDDLPVPEVADGV